MTVGLRVAPRLLCCCAVALLAIPPTAALFFSFSAAPAAAGAAGAVPQARWLPLLVNTTVVAGTAAAIATLVGAAGALLAVRTDLPGRWVLRTFAAAAVTLPPYVIAVAVFSVVPPWSWTGSRVACGTLYGLTYAPLAGFVIGAGLRAVSRDLEDAALLDAGPLPVLARVTLRRSRGSLLAAGVLVIWLTATDFTYTDLLVVRTFAEEVYTQFALGRGAGPLQTAVPLILIAWLAALAGLVLLQRRTRDASTASTSLPRIFKLGRWRWPAAALVFAVLALVAGLPAIGLARRLLPLTGLVQTARGFLPELSATGSLAAIAAVLMLLPAGSLAWWIVGEGGDGHRRRLLVSRSPASGTEGPHDRVVLRGGLIVMVLALALALPAPVVGVTLIELLNRPGWRGGIYDSPAIIVLGYFARFAPVAVALLVPAAARLPQELLDAARIDGCGNTRIAWHVRMPALRRDALVAFLVLMILCFGELGTTALVAPPGWPTVSVRAFSLLHFGVYRDLAVLAVLAAAAILVPCLVLVCLYRRGLR